MHTLRSITFLISLALAPALFAQCSISIGNDTTVCAGEPVTVIAPGGHPNYLWSDGSTGQSITTTLSGIVWAEVSYTTPNLVFNGDFSQGNTGFTTGYTLNDPIWNDPEYNITTDASFVHPFFQGLGNTGGGNFFVGNGGTNSAALNVWCQTINNLCENTDYLISTWISSVEPTNPAELQFEANGTLIGGVNNPLPGPGVWTPMSSTWNSGNSTSLDLCLINWNGWGTGNDFGIDDISVVGNVVLRDTMVITHLPLPIVDLGPDTILCAGEFMTLDVTRPNATYLWSDNSTNSSLNVMLPGIYWVIVTENGCSNSDAIIVTYVAIPSATLGSDTTLCVGQNILLDATYPNANYLWQDGSTNPDLLVNTAGTFWVDVTTNNCTVRDSIDIVYQAYPVVDLGPDTALCIGEIIALDAFSAGANYLWQDASTNSTFNINTAGQYWVAVTIGYCTTSDTINVNYNALPIVGLGSDTAICQGETLLLDATLAGASYSWQDATTQATLNVISAGTYWVDVTTNNCTTRDSIDVLVNPYPQVDLGNDTIICVGANITLDATVPGASYLWNDNSIAPTLNTSIAGTYWVEVTLNNCTSNDTIIISIQALPIVDLGNDTSLCPGDQLLLDATLLGAIYLWNNGSNAATLIADPGNTYWVDVTVNNCTASDTIIIGTAPLPQVDLGNDTTLCAGEILLLTALWPGSIYLWDNASTSATRTISTPGTYWVEVSLNNCTVSDTIVVNYISPQGINLGLDTAICAGASLLLDAATPGGTYLWQDNSTNSNLNVSIAGIYWVEVTSNGCSAADTIVVSITQPPLVDLGNDTTVCPGEFVLFNANIPSATYLWSNSAVTSSISVNTPGLYWVDVTNNFCSASDTVQLSNFNLPVVDIGNDTTLCPGEMLLLDAQIASGSYAWQDGSANSTFNVNTAGIFWVDVSVNGCTVRDSIAVDYLNIAAIDLGNDTTLCAGEILLLDATTAGANYTWQDGSAQATFSVSNAGTYWVDVATSGCVVRDSILVQYQALPQVDLGPDSTLCAGSALLLDATLNGATYLWQDGSNLPTLLVTNAANYWVQLTMNGCSNSDSIEISIQALPIVDFGTDSSLCAGEILVLNASLPGATYEWQDGSTNATFNANVTSTYWVDVLETICSNSDTIELTFVDPSTFSLGNDTSMCAGNQLVLDATTTGAVYLWNDGSTQATLTVTTPGNYWVTISLSNCSATDSVQVDQAPMPIVDLGPDTIICNGTTLTLSVAQTGASYLWQDGSTNADLVVSNAGNYSVEVTLGLCLASDAISIDPMEAPTVVLPSFESICEGETVELDASYPGATYLWNDGSTDAILFTGTAGNYSVSVSNVCGDAQSATLVEVEDCACTVYVPNAFTPDGNGVNEGFAPVMECDLLNFTFRIFDRWGEELFNTSDPSDYWNGEYFGQPVADGVYIWVLEYKGLSSAGIEAERKMGHVTVLR